jgi:hypothetical protein
MRRAGSRGPRAAGREQKNSEARCLKLHALCSKLCFPSPMLYVLCSLILLSYACSSLMPPDDYYQEVLEMEKHGEQARSDTGRQPGEIITPVKEPEPVEVERPTVKQLPQEVVQQDVEEILILNQEKEEVQEQPPQREAVEKPVSPQILPSLPIAVAAEVIKSALNSADLGISVRTVELVNGRLSGGKNSVRVNFLSESLDLIDDRFVAICAVIYHLDRGKNTVDIVAGIAEDSQANLIAIVQSKMDNIAAWMNNEISRAEWFSKVTKKVL